MQNHLSARLLAEFIGTFAFVFVGAGAAAVVGTGAGLNGIAAVENVSDPVYAPNSKGGPKADPVQNPQVEVWQATGEFVHAAYTKRKDDDDFGQAGTLVRKVMDNAARDRLVSNVVGHLKDGVTEPVLARAFEYWRKIDQAVGDRIAQGVKGKRIAAE
jgi:catalase